MSAITHATHLGFAALLLAASVAAASEARMYKGYETPPYEVLQADGAIELRRYGPHLVAEVAVEGSRTGAVSRGFRALARYIFGGNAGAQKVAMTAPVAQLPAGEPDAASQSWTVRFMMPSRFDLASLPAPDNAEIRFVTVAPQTQAVIRFSGFWTNGKLAAQAQALQAWAAAQGVALEGRPQYYFYDDPFTLPFNRRNEVAFAVR